MANFSVSQFNGIAPKIAPRLLAESIAQSALNVRLDSGRLEALPDHSASVTTVPSGTNTVYLYSGSIWKSYASQVDIVEGPIVNDVTERVYYTGETYPKVYRNDGGPYRLGVPAPTAAPTVSVTGAVSPDELEESRSYVVTFVTSWGEEGPPSFASTAVAFRNGQTTTLSLPAMPSTSGLNFTTGSLKRIYRTNTGSSSTGFQFVAEVAYTATSYVELGTANSSYASTTTPTMVGGVVSAQATTSTALGELIPSVTWMRPPDDNATLFPTGPMQGICSIGNGIMAGFTGKTLCFSVPYLPHAWPTSYQLATESDIVAIKPTPGGLVVGTKGKPYIAQGSDPASISLIQLESDQACVSKMSMVDMGGYVIYASPDGLVTVQGQQIQLVTEALLRRSQWQAYNPTTLKAMNYEGTYIASNATESILFDPRGGKNALSTSSETYDGAYNHLESDCLYFVDGTAVKKFGQGSGFANYVWKSKSYVSTKPRNLGWARVDADSYPITFKLFTDVTPPALTTFAVTVSNPGSGNKYYIDGVMQATVSLKEGYTYKFDQSASSNSGHPLRFSATSNGTHNSGSAYTTGVTTVGTAGSAGAYTQIVVAASAATLYYYCTNHSGMGGTATTPANANLAYTYSVTSNDPFHLPSGSRVKQWEFEVAGTAPVNSISIADNVNELL